MFGATKHDATHGTDIQTDMHTNVKDVIRAFGTVFGDIGTSPIYTFAAIFLFIPATAEHVIGVLSLTIWTLILVVTVQYVWLAMSLNCNGEGGTIVLRETLMRLVMRRVVATRVVALLSFLGISLSIGDSIITPAISILSAVEGLSLMPRFHDISNTAIVTISCVLVVALFAIQRKGTEKVGNLFGPIMVLWFLIIGVVGSIQLFSNPTVLIAFNPIYGVRYILNHGLIGVSVLSNIVLCATGGEALFADMGHIGRGPITYGWIFIFIALSLSYTGQGAFLLSTYTAHDLFFKMLFALSPQLYPCFVVLSIITTIIASQAVISSVYSICFQSINTKLMPRMRVRYTSLHHKSQIYIPVVNWFLMLAVIMIILLFRNSTRLSSAYGFAMSGTMSITGILLVWIFWAKCKYRVFFIALLIVLVDFSFLIAGLKKLPYGGYWSIILASIPFSIIVLYAMGRYRLSKHTKPMAIGTFLNAFKKAYSKSFTIDATAVFLVHDSFRLPVYVYNTMIVNRIIYKDNVLVSLQKHDNPFALEYEFAYDLAPGLRHFIINVGYMTYVDVGRIFLEVGISPSAIFYGIDEIETRNFFWSIFAFIKKISPSFVKFHKLPIDKLHGVLMSTEM